MAGPEIDEDVTDWVERLHATVDELVRPLVALHADALSCRAGCAGCCEDGLSVFAIEAARIARHHRDLLDHGVPHEEGACAFLDERGRCRIYEERPYVCRTQGLPLRWLSETDDGEAFEARDVCSLNLQDVAIETLPAEAFWTLGPVEQRLLSKQKEVDGGRAERVPLRDLFGAAPSRPRRLPLAPR
jgi:uncharacterized protein